MSQVRNIYAYTMPGSDYPAYISINTTTADRPRVSVTVRGAAVRFAPLGNGSGTEPPIMQNFTASIELTPEQALDIARSLIGFYYDLPRPDRQKENAASAA